MGFHTFGLNFKISDQMNCSNEYNNTTQVTYYNTTEIKYIYNVHTFDVSSLNIKNQTLAYAYS